jgi:hypothetical protein
MQVVAGAFLLYYYYFFYRFDHHLVGCLAIIGFFLLDLRIWLKFRHVANVWDEIPF